MKTLFRWVFRGFILLVVLTVACILLLDTMLREVLQREIRLRTGMDARIGSLDVGLLSPVITLENFKLYNSAEFGGSPFLDMPELHLEYDFRALRSRKLHFRLVRCNLTEMDVVQNKVGKTNLQALSDAADASNAKTGGAGTSSGSSFDFAGIDTLNLTVGKATLLKMKHPGRPKEVVLNIRNQVIADIRTEQELALKIFLVLAQTGGASLLNFVADESAPPPSAAKPAAPVPLSSLAETALKQSAK
jgi:hypothetical protein